jgi:hypothetical protein
VGFQLPRQRQIMRSPLQCGTVARGNRSERRVLVDRGRCSRASLEANAETNLAPTRPQVAKCEIEPKTSAMVNW